jgi:nitrite reductase (NO-forming)
MRIEAEYGQAWLPLDVSPNQLLRVYVVNAGPNRISSFHVVAGIVQRVFQDGSQANPLMGVQTVKRPSGWRLNL